MPGLQSASNEPTLEYMDSEAKKYNIIWMDEVDSTNSEAVRRLESLDNMSVLAARCQSAGRGKDTHKWLTAPGENLTFTIVLKYSSSGPSEKLSSGGQSDAENAISIPPYPPFPAANQMLLSAAAAASVVNFLAGEGISAWVKWPNDVYVGKKKICGILIEHRIIGTQLKSSIIGIGINLNQTVFDPLVPNPTSVALLSGRKLDITEALERFCGIFARKMELVYSEAAHLGDIISRTFALENGAAGDENLRACFAECVNVLL